MSSYKKCPKCGRFHGVTDKNYCTDCGALLRGVTLSDGANKESPSEGEMSYSESNRAYAVRRLFNRHKTVIVTALAALIIVPALFFGIYNSQGNIYGRAITALENGDVDKALELSYKLNDNYNDAKQLEDYCRARRNESADWYTYQSYIALGTYRDSAERAKASGYEYAALVVSGGRSLSVDDVDNAESILSNLSDYKDSANLLAQIPELRNEALYAEAVRLFESAENTTAQVSAGN
jgi:hypothetical protein